MLVVNVKENFPTVEESRNILYKAIKENKRARIVKVIHGYGSTGVGGSIKRGLKKTFANMIKTKKIIDYIDGADFHLFNEKTLLLLGEYPDLKNDNDLKGLNEGITILIIK